LRSWVVAAAAALAFVPDASATWEIGGHAKAQVTGRFLASDEAGARTIGERSALGMGDVRLNTAYTRGAWDVTAQAQLLTRHGRLPDAGSDPAAAALPSDSRQALDLTGTLSEGSSHDVLARMDRLSVGYASGPLALRAGRQASSWGNGLVFQVLDLFDPFPPNALDTEYKPGRDMLFAQWLLPGGDDVQAIVVPGSAERSRTLTATESSAALQWRTFRGPLQLQLLAARHLRDDVGGLGLGGNVGGGVWRFDLSVTVPHDGGAVTSFLLDVDRSWTVTGRNLYGFAEYFRNGFGATSLDRGIEGLDPRLLDRVRRGELFSLGRDELAAGFRLEWTALTTLETTLLLNPRDGSADPLLHVHHDWSQNRVLDAGLQLGLGRRATEYGGVPSTEPGVLVAPGRTLWGRIAQYF
jgi:hypothetical protein